MQPLRLRSRSQACWALPWLSPVTRARKSVARPTETGITSTRPPMLLCAPWAADRAWSGEVKAPTWTPQPPVVANQTLYVLDQKGKLSAYR